jgi:hypothetical protein
MLSKSKIVFLTATAVLMAGTASTWWNQSWEYRKPINATEQSGQKLNSYQLELSLNTEILISKGKMQGDCDDIRFSNVTDDGKLDYWIKGGCNSSSTEVVVEIPDLRSGDEERIYFYYGNNDANSGSSPYSTYLFYDDFRGDLSKWTTNGGVSISNGRLVVDTGNSGSTWQGAFSKKKFGDTNGDIEILMRNLTHTYNYDDNNLNVGMVDPAVDPNSNPDGADPKISIEHTESYSGSRLEFICGSSYTQSVTPDYSNSDWSFTFGGDSAEIYDGTENVSSSNVCDTDYEIMFSIEKESGLDRIEVDKVLVRRYAVKKPTIDVGSEEISSICDRRGNRNQCIIDSKKELSNKNSDLTSIFETKDTAQIISYSAESSISVSNNSLISGLWKGNIDFSAAEMTLRPGASFTPENRIILNETG